MGELLMALQQMLVMITIIAMGVVATKLKILDDEMLAKCTRLMVYVTLPSMILASASKLQLGSGMEQLPWAFGLAALLIALSIGSTLVFNFIFRTPREERVLYLFMSACTNMGFIGISVVSAIFGSEAVFPASIFVLASNFSIFSIGFMILDTGVKREKSLRPDTLKDILRTLKSLLNPSTVSCMLAIPLVALDLHLPAFLQNVLNDVGGITAPLAMLLVGVIIAGIHPKEMIKGWRIYAFIGFRQLLVPLAAVAVLLNFNPDLTVLRVFAIMAAMPVGSMSPVLVAQFGYDSKLVAKTTVLSTLLSLAIVPLLLTIIAMWT